jgi:serine/threonine protein phosphatase PrpC
MTYKGVHISVKGSTHVKKGTECQDVSSTLEGESFGLAVVCDGHGGERHFRSAIGAKFAADISIKAMKKFVEEANDLSKENSDELLKKLESDVFNNWKKEIENHLKENAFSDIELTQLSNKDGNLIESSRFEIAYGSTLVSAVLTEKHFFVLQLGDGDCVLLDKKGNIRTPNLPHDDRLRFNITTSLCDENALQNFRHYWSDDEPIVAILLSTDGVRNSFENESYYKSFCRTVFESFSEGSQEEAKKELSEFLEKLTERGSGDDVSISMIYNAMELKDTLNQNTDNILKDENIE